MPVHYQVDTLPHMQRLLKYLEEGLVELEQVHARGARPLSPPVRSGGCRRARTPYAGRMSLERFDVAGRYQPRAFPVARFGDASTLKVGDRVLALGSPLALSQSVTMGIVSNTEMIMPGMFWPFNRMTLDGEVVGSGLLGQSFTAPEYFHGRPSAAGAPIR